MYPSFTLPYTAAHTTTDVNTQSLDEEKNEAWNGLIGAEKHIPTFVSQTLFLPEFLFDSTITEIHPHTNTFILLKQPHQPSLFGFL